MESKWLRSLYESEALAIGCWQADGRLTAFNPALSALIGYSFEEIEAGQVLWSDITPSEYAPLDAQALDEIKTNGYCRPYQKEYVRKDGHRVPILVGGACFGEEVKDAGTFYAVDLSRS